MVASIPLWLEVGGAFLAVPAGFVIFAGAWALWRGGGGTAIQSLQIANDVLEKRVHELTEQNKRQAGEISELRARTDVAIALNPVLEALKLHEVEAAKRSEATLTVLALIAERLGPDGERKAD